MVRNGEAGLELNVSRPCRHDLDPAPTACEYMSCGSEAEMCPQVPALSLAPQESSAHRPWASCDVRSVGRTTCRLQDSACPALVSSYVTAPPPPRDADKKEFWGLNRK